MKSIGIAIIFCLAFSPSATWGKVNAGIDTSAVLSKVSRNFLIFRIVMANEHIRSFAKHDGYLSSSTDIHFLNYLPPDSCKLELKLKEYSYTFPDSNYKVFEVIKGMGLYRCSRWIIDAKPYPYDEERRMLIAVEKTTNQVIFISGRFFLQDIRHYYDFKKGTTEIEQYLELRNFMYGIDEVKFKTKRGRHYYFEGKNLEGKLIADMEVIMKNGAIKYTNLKLW